MLKSLYTDNYKCLVNFELSFQDVTLLLGANGSPAHSVTAKASGGSALRRARTWTL